MERSLKITTKANFERLVQLMENNPEIARGKPKFGMTKSSCKDLWEGIALELNSLGPPSRTSPEWQRIHYKASIKKKLSNNKRNNQTGSGPSEEICLNSLEDCVSQLLSLSEQVAPAGETFGLERIHVDLNESTKQAAEKLLNVPTRRRRVNSPEQERLELLEKQAETQGAILKTFKELRKNSLQEL